jgi:hypothetical protein
MSYDLSLSNYDDEGTRRLTKAEKEAFRAFQRELLGDRLDTKLAAEKAKDIMWLGSVIIDEADDLLDYAVQKAGNSELGLKTNWTIYQQALNGAARVQRQHSREMER